MYAIAFDLDTAALEKHHPSDSWNKAYREIKKVLKEHGFERQQGSVYYGDENVTSVSTVLAVQDLSRRLPWLKESVKDIRILQLLASDDLKPAL
jgi:CRISPR-associated endonuclease Cas2